MTAELAEIYPGRWPAALIAVGPAACAQGDGARDGIVRGPRSCALLCPSLPSLRPPRPPRPLRLEPWPLAFLDYDVARFAQLGVP